MYANQEHTFVKHGPCEKCGSKDNVAWYSGGTGFCFGCGAFYRERRRPSELSYDTSNNETASRGQLPTGIRPPPDDCVSHYPPVVLDWMQAYDITVTDLIHFNVKWSYNREQLVYLFYGEGKDVVLWQARNFRASTTHKDRYFTGGTPEKVIAAYYPKQGEDKGAVVVEDCASGIKLAKSGYVGIPCFGSKMSPEKMRRICALYDNVIWWLDSDMFDVAVRQSNQCKLMGVKSKVIHTAYDPKEYTIAEVNDILSNRRYEGRFN